MQVLKFLKYVCVFDWNFYVFLLEIWYWNLNMYVCLLEIWCWNLICMCFCLKSFLLIDTISWVSCIEWYGTFIFKSFVVYLIPDFLLYVTGAYIMILARVFRWSKDIFVDIRFKHQNNINSHSFEKNGSTKSVAKVVESMATSHWFHGFENILLWFGFCRILFGL